MVVAPVGEVDMASAAVFEEAIIKADGRTVIVDLRGVEFMDSIGLAALLRGTQTRSSQGGEVQVIRGPRCVDQLFDVTFTRSRIRFVDRNVVDMPSAEIWLG